MTLRVLVFAEDVLGMALARDLSDRVVVERCADWPADVWSDRDLRETQRSWGGIEPAEPWTTWSRAKALARELGGATHGLGLRGYGLEAYRAARIAARQEPLPDLVVLCRDTDGHESLRADMLAGLSHARVDVPVVLAVAHQEAEAWVIAGFFATHEAEVATLRKLRSEHGFDPTSEPHRLTAKRREDPHDAKRVRDALLPDGSFSERGQRCWLDTPLADLERRGARTGLPEYLEDVAQIVLPLLCGPGRPQGRAVRDRA